MNAKATTLFFILLALANCTNTGSKTTQEHDLQGEDAEDQLPAIGILESTLTDLSTNEESAIQNFSELIGSYLGIEVAHSEKNLYLRLAVLLDYKSYDPKLFADVPEDFKLEDKANEILAGIPTYQELLKDAGNNKGKAANDVLDLAATSFDSYIHHLQTSFRNKWYTQVKATGEKFRQASEKVEVPDMELVKYQKNTKVFGTSLQKKIKEMTEISKQEDFTVRFNQISQKFVQDAENFYTTAQDLTWEITNMLASPLDFLHTAAEQLFTNARDLLATHEDLKTTENANKLAATKERITLLVGTLAQLTEELKRNNHLRAILQTVSIHANLKSVVIDPLSSQSLDLVPEFQDFSAQVFQSMVNAVISLPVDTSMIHSEIISFLNAKVHLHDNNPDVRSTIRDNAVVHTVASSAGRDLAAKIRNLDLILYRDVTEFSKSERDTLYEDVYSIHSADSDRVNIAQRLKTLFTIPVLLNQHFPSVRSALYEATLFCTNHIEGDMLGQDSHEIFDKCLDIAKRDGSEKWVKEHFITFKLLNLLFVSKTSTYKTTFPVLQSSDADVQALFQLGKDLESLGTRLKTKFQLISKNYNTEALENTDYITEYSGKTYDASLFNAVRRTENDSVSQNAKIQVDRAHVKVNFHDDETSVEPGNKINVDSNPQTNKKPTFNVDDPFSGFIESIPEDQNPIPDRIQKGQYFNFVNQIIERVPANMYDAQLSNLPQLSK